MAANDEGKLNWGLLGTEHASSARRVRTLGVGSAVRRFNDLAVPGMGGVWFGKQLVVATLGVAVAQAARERDAGVQAKVQTIETANAIEALACLWALQNSHWKGDARLRGANKLRAMAENETPSFRVLRKPAAYVSQPMRMSTVQPLRSLGFVESAQERFSSFACSPIGFELLDLAGMHEAKRSQLVKWISGEVQKLRVPELEMVRTLPGPAREYLRERLVAGTVTEASRRATALAWVETRRNATAPATWDDRPLMLEASHWTDLRVGALFFDARQAALGVLDQVERLMLNKTTAQVWRLEKGLPEELKPAMEEAQRCAGEFLERRHDPTGGVAKTFCDELINEDRSQTLRDLVRRDGRVLFLRENDEVVPGPAFGTQGDAPGDAAIEEDVDGSDAWPVGISPRVHNLFLMNLDMHGELEAWLQPNASEANND